MWVRDSNLSKNEVHNLKDKCETGSEAKNRVIEYQNWVVNTVMIMFLKRIFMWITTLKPIKCSMNHLIYK